MDRQSRRESVSSGCLSKPNGVGELPQVSTGWLGITISWPAGITLNPILVARCDVVSSVSGKYYFLVQTQLIHKVYIQGIIKTQHSKELSRSTTK